MARLLWLLPVGLLQACAGTPVAEQLERSFAVPQDKPAQLAAPVPAVKTSPPVASPPTAERPFEPVPKPASQPEPEDAPEPVPQPKPRTVSSQRQPQEPYRITIRLAGADPAAPAEAVTRALRDADVGFAVERIERVEP
ncbi:hypothetical protein [Parasynechococcus sp.]|uniref:hypothetical protein n=1 Tax=Parasynechococcus sp. TaxID=3101203 RepID=UPI0037038526